MMKVTRFRSIDGKVFSTETECKNWESKVRLSKEYEDNKLYGMYEGCRIEWKDFIEWVSDNKDMVRAILDVC